MSDLLPAPMPLPLSDLIPERHLARLAGLDRPRVVIVGDSISTPGPSTTHDMLESFWGHFIRAFLLANPGLRPEFLNRAIGKARFHDFAGARLGDTFAGEQDYPWLGSRDEPWFENVRKSAPDLLIQAFGMNDSGKFSTRGFLDLQARIDGWEKQPDRLYVTTMIPSREAETEAVRSEAGQAGRQFNAHYVRSWALYHGHGLIDLNRVQMQAVQGVDPRVSSLTRLRGKRRDLPSEGPEPCQDFGIVLEGKTLGQTLDAGLVLTIGAGAPGNGRTGATLRLVRNEHALLAEFTDGGDAPEIYLRIEGAAPLPARPGRLSIFVKDVFAHVEVDGQTQVLTRVRRHGGLFRPRLARADGARAEALVTHYAGQLRRHDPILSDGAAFGTSMAEARFTGGNAINHPASLLGTHVFTPLFEGLRLTVPAALTTTAAPEARSGGL